MEQTVITIGNDCKGAIKIMNAVNNGPKEFGCDQSRGNFNAYKALEIPYARIHDAAHCHAYGGWHSVDITGIFPDFSKDADAPESYDFTLTDRYLATMRQAGTEPFFRLGQSIEHWKKKYGVNPPADFDKWASICDHIVRHYNEGWANGFNWNITYWEIWNEPDLEERTDGTPSPTWTGTQEQFIQLFEKTARLLKANHPNIKVGGPALAWNMQWAEKFLECLQKDNVPLDFFSWHVYACVPEPLADKAVAVRALMDKYGYEKAESILNEWNYVRGWTDEWVYSLNVESGEMNYKGAAFIAAAMICCQHVPLDLLMFYDARVGCAMNNLFDVTSMEPLRGYYPFVAWARLRRLGTEVSVSAENADGFYSIAAVGPDGRLGALIVRYTDNDNVSASLNVTVKAEGRSLANAKCHLTDKTYFFSEVIPAANDDGSITIAFKPNSFAFIEA